MCYSTLCTEQNSTQQQKTRICETERKQQSLTTVSEITKHTIDMDEKESKIERKSNPLPKQKHVGLQNATERYGEYNARREPALNDEYLNKNTNTTKVIYTTKSVNSPSIKKNDKLGDINTHKEKENNLVMDETMGEGLTSKHKDGKKKKKPEPVLEECKQRGTKKEKQRRQQNKNLNRWHTYKCQDERNRVLEASCTNAFAKTINNIKYQFDWIKYVEKRKSSKILDAIYRKTLYSSRNYPRPYQKKKPKLV